MAHKRRYIVHGIGVSQLSEQLIFLIATGIGWTYQDVKINDCKVFYQWNTIQGDQGSCLGWVRYPDRRNHCR